MHEYANAKRCSVANDLAIVLVRERGAEGVEETQRTQAAKKLKASVSPGGAGSVGIGQGSVGVSPILKQEMDPI